MFKNKNFHNIMCQELSWRDSAGNSLPFEGLYSVGKQQINTSCSSVSRWVSVDWCLRRAEQSDLPKDFRVPSVRGKLHTEFLFCSVFRSMPFGGIHLHAFWNLSVNVHKAGHESKCCLESGEKFSAPCWPLPVPLLKQQLIDGWFKEEQMLKLQLAAN